MKKWILSLLISVSFLIAFKANGQNIVQTYIDPCDNKVYTVVVPISSNQPGVLVLIRNKSRIFTYADFASGTVTKWVNDIFSTPCPVAITATDVAAPADDTSHIKSASNNMYSHISSNSLVYLNRTRTSIVMEIIRALQASRGLGIERLGSI